MKEKLIRATHQGELKIGDVNIPCAVLEDGRRVLTQQGFLLSIGRSRTAKGGQGAVDKNVAFLAAKNLKPFVSSELEASTTPIVFQSLSGVVAYGFEAKLLPLVCRVYMDAQAHGALHLKQAHIAEQCRILLRSMEKIGIVALVDEATGYQYDRDKQDLQKLLALYIREELLPWAEMFPREFYKQIFRLKGWQFSTLHSKRPRMVGKITNEIVYERLPPGVLRELQTKNPVVYRDGSRKNKNFQYLTEDIGQPHLRNHLIGVIALMRASANWSAFKRMLERAYPKHGDQLQLEYPDD